MFLIIKKHVQNANVQKRRFANPLQMFLIYEAKVADRSMSKSEPVAAWGVGHGVC